MIPLLPFWIPDRSAMQTFWVATSLSCPINLSQCSCAAWQQCALANVCMIGWVAEAGMHSHTDMHSQTQGVREEA